MFRQVISYMQETKEIGGMSANTGILVHCEVTDGRLAPIATEILGAGRRLALELEQELSAVLIGSNIGGTAQEAIAYGADRVYVVDDPFLQDYATEPHLMAMEKVVRQALPAIILLGQTLAGRDLAPWLAFRLNTGATMDCVTLEIDPASKRLLMTRPVYGGNAQAIQVCKTDPQIAAVRQKAMAPLAKDTTRRGQVIKVSSGIVPVAPKVKVLERKIEPTAGIKLEDARVVVAGGRGIGSADGFKQLEEIAGLLHGAVGATRPPCDARWVTESRQIGITGKIVSPDLYIAVALSGASQHLSGFFNSKVIVAINKDPEANIFKVAHYGIVADWETVLPTFTARLKEVFK
jgi:electron transfer flavoprotein alpha subunit